MKIEDEEYGAEYEEEIVDIGTDFQPFSMQFQPWFVLEKKPETKKNDKRYSQIEDTDEQTEFNISGQSDPCKNSNKGDVLILEQI